MSKRKTAGELAVKLSADLFAAQYRAYRDNEPEWALAFERARRLLEGVSQPEPIDVSVTVDTSS